MTLKKSILFLFFLSIKAVFSQDYTLSILSIPDSLTQNANAVVRYYDTRIDMLSDKKMSIKVKKAITILNKKGNQNAKIVVYYDKSNHIKKLKIKILDSFGNKLKEVRSKEIKDISAADGFSLFNDNRLKYYKHTPISYPYTIVYEYVKESSNTAFIPQWFPVDSYFLSVQQSTFSLTYPLELTIRKVERNIKNYPIQSKAIDGKISYKGHGIKAIRQEELSPDLIKIIPSVRLASNKFFLEGVSGKANNWEAFGRWMYNNLIVNRTEIPEETKSEIRALVKNVKDTIEKAKVIYEYVQKKTRYVSVQAGIGGWMPMLAEEVDKFSYGDCKALTNYTRSLLEVAGVESYYTAVFAGSQKRNIENEVVAMQGNHVFLYLPSEGKDIWLECTTQTLPFGYQGKFTDDRDVLVIKPEGGEIKHTGTYKDEENFQRTVAEYQIKVDGSLEAIVKIQSGGIQYEDHYHLEKKAKREIDQYYKSKYWSEINNLEIEQYSFEKKPNPIAFVENLKIQASNYANYSANRLLFIVNAFNRSTYIPKRYRNRELPVEISRGFLDTDHFKIKIPDGFKIEAIPENVLIDNKFGKYQFTITKNENQLDFSRTFLIKKGQYPRSDYKALRSFFKKVAKIDKSKIVLLKYK